jgi:hypothetical protein
VDALYTAIQRNLGLDATSGAAKQIIEVSVTHIPGADSFRLRSHDRFIVSSPALYLAPMELTDAEILAQSLAFPLVDYLLTQAVERQPIRLTWLPMLRGLRLWQLWDLDLPLATWREAVGWVYTDLPGGEHETTIVLPAHYTELCAAHTLWMPYPEKIHIPLFCDKLERSEWVFPWQFERDSRTHLTQLAALGMTDVPVDGNYVDGTHKANHPGQTVALATLFEYVVATYGRERLPALLHGLGHYSTWETLLPAVLGVSPAEFEAGWQAYLATHYLENH